MVYPPADGKTPCAVTNLHTIRLHEKDHGFSIEFSTLNYGNCNRVKYAYRLKNYENEWTETLPGEHTARYNFVPPENMCSKSVPQTRKDIGPIK